MNTVYPLSNDTWGKEEEAAAQNVLTSRCFTMGQSVALYEKQFAAHFGSAYAVMSSSGSAANLLGIAAMVYSGRLSGGDEVLVPAVSWSTTYFPLEQMGLKMRLVDIDRNTLNMDLAKAARALTPKTRAVFAVNLLGNPNDFHALQSFCTEHNLILMEDNCESMGAKYDGKMTGTFGVFGSFSSFYSHHVCTMEGGMTVTDDEELYHYMLSVRAHGWTRNLPADSRLHRKDENPFYESFCFVVPGFNLRPLEIEGAVGLEQLKKLDGFIAKRRANADYFRHVMSRDSRFFVQKETGESSWFGFALILSEDNADQRDLFVAALRAHGIEVRPIVAGNFARQPVFSKVNATVFGELVDADYIHENGFFVGNHSVDMRQQIDYLKKVLDGVGS